MTNRLDVIIFGATGFTGSRVVLQLIKIIKSENLTLTWGIAGRSIEKLKRTLLEVQRKTAEDYSNISVICADVNDKKSLENMTIQAQVVINSVGPYILLGENVVKACIKTKTHHIDVTAEHIFLETVQLNYHQAAKESGIYLIGACGLDCIPADLGAMFLQKNFEGTLNSVECFMYVTEEEGSTPGSLAHSTTYESFIHVITHYSKLRSIRKQLFTKELPELKPKLKIRGPIFRSNFINKWTTIYPSTDLSVMNRTQRYMYETHNKRPVQMQTYCSYTNIFEMVFVVILLGLAIIACQFRFTRNLLLKHPKLFSCDIFSQEGPTEKKEESTHYHAVFHGEGWKDKLEEPTDNFTTPPNKTLTARVSGKNGYTATAVGCILSAVMILTEKDKMPHSGGCYTTGVAFENTSIIAKLNKYGMKFELNPQL